jgi:DNA polymerase-3 subunit chi
VMAEVWFYHLERTSLEQALPELLEKVLARGWKGQVRLRDAARVEALDQHLWTWRDDSFLPHGPAGEPHAARQPILLTTEAENVNGAEALLLVDGAEPGDLAGYERVMVLFDGNDEAALATARAQWSALKARGEDLSYWRQEGRGWKKQ